MVGSQGYVEDSASADDIKIFFSAYVHRITNKRLLGPALPSYNPDDIYVKSPRVHFIGQYGSSHSAQDDIHMICIRSNFIPTSTSINLNIPTSLQPIKQLPMIGHIIYMIYVQHSWIGIRQKVWSVSMEMGDILLVWYVHNNQLYCNDDGGRLTDSTIY